MKDIVKELNVEKLNIVEPDGRVKLSLFNSQHIPSLILEDEDLLPGHRANDGISGLMFYNNHGDECGGLIYGSNIDESGKVSMGMSLTLDKWKQDQVVQLHLNKEDDQEQYGISIFDRPDYSIRKSLEILKEARAETDQEKQQELIKKMYVGNHKRMFIGRDVDGETKVSIFDKSGKEKFKISVDENDELKIIVEGKEVSI